MSLSIEQLTRHPQLGVSYLAGRSGGSRAVLWAHTCELPEPWQWLGTGDLLLTDGYSFPADGIEQAAFIQQLASSGLSGLMLADGLGAAPLTTAAAAAADALDFPVLQAAYEVPFISCGQDRRGEQLPRHQSPAAHAVADLRPRPAKLGRRVARRWPHRPDGGRDRVRPLGP